MRLIALDLVRFFAAMSVVLYHYTATPDNYFDTLSRFTQFGYLGVPIFFIISGYVIALSANNRTAYAFAVSRFTRLYPAYWAGIAFTILTVSLLAQNNFTTTQTFINLTMLQDFLGVKDISPVYWTLQKELQFYGCIFLLVFFNLFAKIRIWLSIWLISTASFLMIHQPFFMGWFITPEYSSFFIAGVAFYLIHKDGVNPFNIAVLSGSLVLSSFYAFSNALEFMIKPTTQEQIIAITLIWFFYLFFYLLVTDKINVRKSNFYLILGALTYPLYLIHGVAGHAIMDGPLKMIPKEVSVPITIVIMILFAYLIHIFIEKNISTTLKTRLLNINWPKTTDKAL